MNVLFVKVVMRLPKAQLVIAGDRPERENLNGLITDLKLATNVSMPGHLSSIGNGCSLVPDWIQVVPSRLARPFGLATAEGMMRGTMMVATNAGGLTGIVQAVGTGLFVPPSDVAAWAEALLHL